MKLESCDILPKIDSTVVAIVTIVVLPRLTDPVILNFVFLTLPEIFKLFLFAGIFRTIFKFRNKNFKNKN